MCVVHPRIEEIHKVIRRNVYGLSIFKISKVETTGAKKPCGQGNIRKNMTVVKIQKMGQIMDEFIG